MDLTSCTDVVKNWFLTTDVHLPKTDQPVILEFKDVSFGYQPNQQTLKGVSFKIHEGEMISIVGKNGAGKSTISKLISGFYSPTSGTRLSLKVKIYVNKRLKNVLKRLD